MKETKNHDWSKVKVGDVLPRFSVGDLNYRKGGIVNKIDKGGGEVWFYIRFTDGEIRVDTDGEYKTFGVAKK